MPGAIFTHESFFNFDKCQHGGESC
uniref:Uncharacterized protein n=1 Tax=Anguilla anguilla TaxID=7936 RepID=A0A0E9VTU2_ANGAN